MLDQIPLVSPTQFHEEPNFYRGGLVRDGKCFDPGRMGALLFYSWMFRLRLTDDGQLLTGIYCGLTK